MAQCEHNGATKPVKQKRDVYNTIVPTWVQLRTGDISASHASGNIGDGDRRGGTDVTLARYLSLIVTSRSRISSACRARLSLLSLSFKQSSRCDRRSSTPVAGVGVPALAVTSRKLGSTGNVG